MNRILLTFILSLTIASIAEGQSTTLVTSTVKDPSGTAYAFGIYSIVFTNPTTQQAFYGGVPLQPSQMLYTGQLDVNGALSVSLPSNAVITPTGTQWTFKICANTAQIAMVYPPPTLPCFSSAQTISGSSQVITFTAAAIPTSGGGVSPNSPLPASSSGPGPVFNVQNYSAKGDAQSSDNCTANGTTLTCTDAAFTVANVGNEVSCAFNYATQLARTTITGFTNGTTVTTAGSGGNQAGSTCVWGTSATVNDAAFTTVRTAWIAAAKARVSAGNIGVFTAAPYFYIPAGNYLLCNFELFAFKSPAATGMVLAGDARESNRLTWETGCNASAANALVEMTGNSTVRIENLLFDGMKGTQGGTGFNTALLLSGSVTLNNIVVQRFGVGTAVIAQGALYARGLQVGPNSSNNFACAGCNADIEDSLFTNGGQGGSGYNFQASNVAAVPNGNGLRLGRGVLVDECGGVACTQLVNSHGVYFEGSALFSTPGQYALSVDGTSFGHMASGLVGVFGTDTNSGGIHIFPGGTWQSSDVRYISSGTGKAIQADSVSQFNDNGGNSAESQFLIASGTSTGTTAVLTLTTAGANVNTNCTVGDALTVEGAGIAGYDGYYPAGATSGITAVTATTLTYTTIGSNMGALGAGGAAYCRNLQGYSGTLPKALLNNPIPNTCYLTITPIVNATNYLLCNFRAQSATNITRIMASSQNVTTCATAPIITLSDGTASVTLTLTSAKQQWDSSVDTSTGVGTTIFKPNGTITVRYDVAAASACATPPTQLAISYNISPILSN